MTYDEAIDLLRENPFNIQLVDAKLIDIRMLRFIRRYHKGHGSWAVSGFGPKSIKDSVFVFVEHVVDFPNQFGWEDIAIDEGAK